MEDQHYVNDMALPVAVIIERPTINETTQLIKHAKEITGQQISGNK